MVTILQLQTHSPNVKKAEITANGEYEIILDNTKKYIFSISKENYTNMNWSAKLTSGGVQESTIISGSTIEGIAVIYKDVVSIEITNYNSPIYIEAKIL